MKKIARSSAARIDSVENRTRNLFAGASILVVAASIFALALIGRPI